MSMVLRYVARLRETVEAWRTGDLDFATYNECQQDMWRSIRSAGAEVEAAVLRELGGKIPLVEVGQLPHRECRTVAVRLSRPHHIASDSHCYRAKVERTETGSLILSIAPVEPASCHGEFRQVAAFVYQLAADMERLSSDLAAHWTIWPQVEGSRVLIELAGDHERGLADDFVETILRNHRLT